MSLPAILTRQVEDLPGPDRGEPRLVLVGHLEFKQLQFEDPGGRVEPALHLSDIDTELTPVRPGEHQGGREPPKWRRQPGPERKLPSTGDLLRLLRIKLLVGAIRPDSFYHFATTARLT